MKKLMLTCAGMLLIGLAAVNAQVTQDTTRTPVQQGDPAVSQPPAQDQTQGQANYQRDLEQVKSSDVPASLRSTLQGSEYRGWEDGMIYRNKSDNSYQVEIGEGTSKKTYRFDRNGKRVNDTGGTPDNK
jgi:hypothetical protein